MNYMLHQSTAHQCRAIPLGCGVISSGGAGGSGSGGGDGGSGRYRNIYRVNVRASFNFVRAQEKLTD